MDPMKKTIGIILASVVGIILLGALFIAALSWAIFSPDPLPDQIVLELNLDRGVIETVPDDPFLLLLERQRLRLRDIVGVLHRAAEDDRVVALHVTGGNPVGGWAMAEEIREAVVHFRASGKPAHFFAETFGEFTPAHGGYYIATAFDEITMQPSGELGISPLSIEAPFFRNALDRLDVIPRFDAREEYKDAVHTFTRDGFSPESREVYTTLLQSLQDRMVQGMAERGVQDPAARLDGGPYGAPDALELGLVDRLGYADEAREYLDEQLDDATRVPVTRYRDRGESAWNRGTRVALVYGIGPIRRGESGSDWMSTGGLASGTVARHIRRAAEDPTVRAIVFRVDSPGGSYVASDQIRREIRRARDNGTPVVVSMGNAAASGGYLISADADRIIAQPQTLTGSIGVAAGKFVAQELFERYGITWDRITLGDGEGGFFSAVGDFSEDEWEQLQNSLDRIYDEFVTIVADGRGMSWDEVDEVARGRVWSGEQALEVGLVDGLGGFPVALDHVRELLELEDDAPIRLTVFPGEPSLIQLLLEGPNVSIDGLRAGARALLSPTPAPVRMPEFGIPGG